MINNLHLNNNHLITHLTAYYFCSEPLPAACKDQ